jgi:hypothetical protein
VATVRAWQLEAGDGVKAPGAPAFSTIRSIEEEKDGRILARFGWGGLFYERNEKVETGHNCPNCGGTKDASYVENGAWHVVPCEVCS